MNDGIYSGMHSLFGSELMTKMDRINEDRDSMDFEL